MRFTLDYKRRILATSMGRIPAIVPLLEQAKYIGYQGYTSCNVMAVCSFNMMFTFVMTGWPGSVHNTRVLQDTHYLWQHVSTSTEGNVLGKPNCFLQLLLV